MQIVLAPNQLLRQKSKEVKKITPDLLKTIALMINITQNFKDPEGVGLSAPQVGINERFFIAKFGENFCEFINPKILSFGEVQKVNLEGCLSIPDYYGEVQRPKSVKVSYQDKTGQNVTQSLVGQKAMIFQHEYDHLEGKLFIDDVLSQKRRLFKVVGKDQAGGDIFEEVNLQL